MQWHQLDHMQTIRTLLQTYNHTNTSSLKLYRTDALQDAQPTVPKHTHTHPFNGSFFLGLPRWAGTRKVKPILILVKQETVSGSGISWAICKSAPCSRQTTTPAPLLCFYRLDALPADQPTASKHWRNQQCQSIEAYTYCIKEQCIELHSSLESVHRPAECCVRDWLTAWTQSEWSLLRWGRCRRPPRWGSLTSSTTDQSRRSLVSQQQHTHTHARTRTHTHTLTCCSQFRQSPTLAHPAVPLAWQKSVLWIKPTKIGRHGKLISDWSSTALVLQTLKIWQHLVR